MGLREIIAAAHRTKTALHGTAVVYVADGVEIAIDGALKRRATALLETELGRVVEVESDDWEIEAALLVHAGTPVVPKPGHLIRETIGDRRHTYEVVPFAGEPGARFADTTRQLLKIHTQHIADEAVS